MSVDIHAQLYMYVGVHAHMYMCVTIHAHLYTSMSVHIHVYMCVGIHAHVYVWVYICVGVRVLCTCMWVYIHAYVGVHIHVYVCIHVHVYMCVGVHAHMLILRRALVSCFVTLYCIPLRWGLAKPGARLVWPASPSKPHLTISQPSALDMTCTPRFLCVLGM